MKRSEMIAELEDVFSYLFVEPDDANSVLAFLEKLGMSPPLNTNCDLYDKHSPGLLDWESENEDS